MPATPASAPTAPPGDDGLCRIRHVAPDSERRRDDRRQREQGAEALDRDADGSGEQHGERHAQRFRPHAERGRADRVEDERRERTVKRREREAAGHDQRPCRRDVARGGRQRLAEQQLAEPLRGVGREREQRAEAQQRGDRGGRGRLEPDPLVTRRQCDQDAATIAPAAAPPTSGAPRSAAATSPGRRPWASDSAP